MAPTTKTDARIPAYTYLRTSSDDGKLKAGIPVQRRACEKFIEDRGFRLIEEFCDDGTITGKLPMHARSAGKRLIAALLADGVKTVITYDSKRIGRTQPVFWQFIGMCRDNDVTVLDCQGANLNDTAIGGINGLVAEMDRNQTVKRLAEGKAHWRAKDKKRRLEGRWPYGEHPKREFDRERVVVERIHKLHAKGTSSYAIAKALADEGIRTRYNKAFTTTTIQRILQRTK
jgi:DNA invertase Pin-like site-specific DNA recombinase